MLPQCEPLLECTGGVVHGSSEQKPTVQNHYEKELQGVSSASEILYTFLTLSSVLDLSNGLARFTYRDLVLY